MNLPPDFEDMELQQEWYGIAEEQDDDDEEEWDEDLELELDDDDDPLNDIQPKGRQVVNEEEIAALRRLPYAEYLKTRHWQQQRKGALERAGHRCQVCNVDELPLEVHHRTYARLGQELPDDLFVLCEICHGLFSKHGRLARENTYPTVTRNAEKKNNPQNSPKFADYGRYDVTRNDRNEDHETASEQAVSPQNETILPEGWTQKKLDTLPLLYESCRNLDKCLEALGISTSQRNRDYTREILKQQGLWKEK